MVRRDDSLNAPGAGDRGSFGPPPAADPARGNPRPAEITDTHPSGSPAGRPADLPSSAPADLPSDAPAGLPGHAPADLPRDASASLPGDAPASITGTGTNAGAGANADANAGANADADADASADAAPNAPRGAARLPRTSELARRIRAAHAAAPGLAPAPVPAPADAALAHQALAAADRGDWETVLRLGRIHSSRIDLTDPAVWPAIFASVPRSALREHPALAFGEELVASLARGSVHVARERLDPVRAPVEGDPAQATASGILSFFPLVESDRLWGRLDAALVHAESLRRLVIERSSEESVQDLAPGAFILVGATLLSMGRYEEALRAFHDAERSARWTAHPVARFAEAYLALGHLLADAPDLAEGNAGSAPTRRTAPPGSWTFVYESATLFVPVLRALADADRDAVRAALEPIDEHAERSPLGWIAAHARARAALLWEPSGAALAEARRALVNLGASAGPGTLVRSVLDADIADLALALGRSEEAVEAAFDREATAPFGLLDAARARIDPELANADAGAGDLDDTLDGPDAPARRARRAVARIDSNEPGLPRNRALVQAASTVREARSAAAVIETSRESRALLWTLLDRAAADCPVADFARVPQRHLDLLTPREREVLLALDTTTPLKQVGARLALSENTLKTHLRSIYRKLGVSSRQELAELVGREFPSDGTADPTNPAGPAGARRRSPGR